MNIARALLGLAGLCALGIASLPAFAGAAPDRQHGSYEFREGSDAAIAGPDPEHGAFAPCHGAHRVTCIVDGDTFWYQGEKIRIADINAPELERPACAYEAQLAQAATDRLTVLLNAGAFTLAPWPRRRIDQYGRSLYVIERGGRSLGLVLVDEGLAERWKGYRGSWC